MTRSEKLERRYRRVLALYPPAFRRDREDEMAAVLMAGAGEGQRWPHPRELTDLARHAAPARVAAGPPPGSFARRNPRQVIAIRLLVAAWLVVVTILLCRYSLWALLLLTVVVIHLYLALRTAVYLRDSAGGREPPTAASL